MPPKRQLIEFKRLTNNPGIEVVPDEADVNVWHVTMTGPDEYMVRAARGAAARRRLGAPAPRRAGRYCL